MSSKVNIEEIDRLAQLARLRFDGEEKDEILNDMNKMIDFINKLDELDTDGVEPLLFMVDETQDLRADDVVISTTQEEALKNAPLKDSDYFKIPKVLDKN
jgi:aspartyl-tRNA(Asn)/glutamyl-tRNA(Gln) amidotransferase subunit C